MHGGDSSPCSKVAGSRQRDACLRASARSVTKITPFLSLPAVAETGRCGGGWFSGEG